jgi:hypothetical protein
MRFAKMTFLEAALLVLAEADNPLTAQEVANRVLGRKLVSSQGKTPDATIASQLYLAVRTRRIPGLDRVFEPGNMRARRGSVRWRYRRP